MLLKKSNKNNHIYKIKNKNYFTKIKKERNYGIDLLRIFSMINIINLHINLFSRQLLLEFSSPKFKAIWRLETFSYPAVNCFGLISGIVGYTKYKFSNLIYLWLTVFFYSITISSYLFYTKNGINQKSLFLSLFPILIKRHWYVNAYFYMYVLLPFINCGISSLNNSSHKNTIIFFILFYTIYYMIAKILNLNGDFNFLNYGYSSMWLVILYIIGAYYGKYIIIKKENKNFLVYLLMFLFSTFLSSELYFGLIKAKVKNNHDMLINYLSPTMLIQAVSLVMIYSKLNIKNKLLIKIISFLVPLNFSAQLIHARLFQTNIKIIKFFFNWILKLKPKLLFFKIYGFGILIYFICIYIDYIRLLIFKILKIRDFSLLIEKTITRLTNRS